MIKLEVLTNAVADALIATGNTKILAEIMKDGSADSIERLALTLPSGSHLQLGLMHFGDIVRTAGLYALLGHEGSSYESHKCADCLSMIPGVVITDNEYWGGAAEAKPLPSLPAPRKKPEMPERKEGEDIVTWLWRCPLWSWVNFNLKRDIPTYQKRNPIWWADREPIDTLGFPGSSYTYKCRRVIGSGDPNEGTKYVRIMESVLKEAVEAGLMELAPDQSIGEKFDTYVLADKYKK